MSTVRHLRALQAFDAVARCRNLTHAARELGVSQSAVSRQIAALESYVGAMLFRRTTTGVTLTQKGEQLHAGTGEAFAILERTIGALLAPANRQLLSISLPAALATKWFVKRLPLFRAEFPHISILLDTSDELIDFSDPAIDVALRYSARQVDGLRYEKLTDEKLVAVAAPALARRLGTPLSPARILEVPILQDDFDPRWQDWLQRVFPGNDLKIAPSIRFRDSAVLIEAAIDGQGIALVRHLMARDDIAAGRLAVIDARPLKLSRSLFMVCRPGDAENTKVIALRRWLMAQLGEDADPAP